MKELIVALLITVIIAAFVFTPFALIWSLNVLFPGLNIAYSFKTWAAALFLISICSAIRIKYETK